MQGHETLELSAEEPEVLLGQKVWVFQDATRELDIEEAASPAFWKNFQASDMEKPNFGYTDAAIWFAFRLRKEDSARWVFHIDTPLIDSISLYTEQPDGTWKVREFGNKQPFFSWDIDHVSPAVFLDLPQGHERRFFVRIVNSSPMVLPTYLMRQDAFQSHTRWHHAAYGLYFGGLFVMVLFNLVLFYSLRERSYIFYIASILTTILLTSSINGFAFKFLYPDLPMLNGYASRVLAGLIVIVTALFAQEFLHTRRYSPLIHRLLYANMGLASIAIVLTVTDIWAGATSKVVSIHSLLLLVSGIVAWRKRNKYARFFVFAWASYILGGLAYTQRIAGNLPSTFWTAHGAEMGSFAEVILLGIALSDRYRMIQQAHEEAIQQALKIEKKAAETLERKVSERTHELTEANQELNQLNEELNAAFETVNLQKSDIEKKNRDIGASINYARRIQRAMLPTEEQMKGHLPEQFILFRPRDIVSGDFYFFAQKGQNSFVAAVDCTGHGVPGAFMSMIGNDLLYQLIDDGLTDTSRILEGLHEGVRRALRQRETKNQDGMTISLCRIDRNEQALYFAGAKQGLFVLREGEPARYVKGSRYEIGGMERENSARTYETHRIPLQSPTTIYMYSDGYQDQIGGPKNRKLRSKPFRALLEEYAPLPPDEQRKQLMQYLNNWMKNESQLDDILVWGIRL